MKQAYLLCYFLLGTALAFAQNCPPTNDVLQLNVPQPAYCSSDVVPFSTNVTAVNYFWSPGQGSTFATVSPNFSFTYDDGGKYEVLLVVDYGNDCRDSVKTEVEIVSSSVNFTYTNDSTTVFFEADTSQYIDNYFWDFGNQLTGSGTSVVTRYVDFGRYPVTLYTSGLCPPDSSTQFIIISPPDTQPEDNAIACADGIDNDGDGDIDCQDSDCMCDADGDGTFANEDPDDNDPCVPNNTVSNCIVDKDGDGSFSDVDPDDNDPCVPDNTVSNCIVDKDGDGSFSNVDPDDNDPCVPDDSVETCQNMNNPQVFEDYPFLTDLVDPNNCTGEKITVYMRGRFIYIFVETATSAKLYFQTGQFYCESAPNYDCIAAFRLRQVIDTWTCDNPNLVDNDNDGTLSDVDPDDNDPCVPDNTVANCDTTVVVIPGFYEDFPWLIDLVDPNDCTNEKIYVYDAGFYSFVFIESDDGGILYFETGTFYCQNGIGFDCREAYGLSTPTEVWTCSPTNVVDEDQDGTPAVADPDDNNPCVPDNTVANCIQDMDGDGSFSDVDPDDNDPCVPNLDAENCIMDNDNDGTLSDVDPDDNDPCLPDNTVSVCDTNAVVIPDFYEDFPWLTDSVDPTNCTTEKISIYKSGSYKFIYIETAETSTLYFQTGAYYCQSGATFDCPSLYGFSNPETLWVCNNSNIADNDMDGVYNNTDPDDDDPCVPNINAENCITDKDNDGTLSDVDPDDNDPCVPDNTVMSCDTTTIPLPDLFKDFPWLTDLFDPFNCTNERVSLYQSGIYTFLYVETADVDKLYFQTGTFYCQSRGTFDCVTAYSLGEPIEVWECDSDTIPPPPPPPAEPDCSKNMGTIVFLDCNDVQFYMIETPEGELLDIYFADGIEFNYYENQPVNYDFEDADFDSPCALADKAVTVTCIEEVRDTNTTGPAIFEEYTFLYSVLDPNNCSSEKVTVYTTGSYEFILVETPTGNSFYFQDGTFYCTHSSSYDCVAAYSLDDSNIMATWTCDQASFSDATTAKNIIKSNNTDLFEKELVVTAYPNPAQDYLWIAIDSPTSQTLGLKIMDRTGRAIIQQDQGVKEGNNRVSLSLEQLQTGMYYLVVQEDTTGVTKMQKVVVVK